MEKDVPMKIGFDGKRAVSNMTGLGNYSRLVVESLASRYPKMELILFTPRTPGDNARLAKMLAAPNIQFRTPTPGEARWGKSVWRTRSITRLLRPSGIELYHGLSNELPLNIDKSGLPSVVTMHDVIYRRLPYCYSAIDRRLYDWKYGASCRAATHIVAVSERTKLDVMYYYGVPEEIISVIYQGCDPQFYTLQSDDAIAEVRRRYALPAHYIVQVGTIERRKNALLSVQALSTLPEQVHLVLVGRPTPYYDRVMKEAYKLGIAQRVHRLEGLPFADLPAIYQGAEAAVYPSYYEGFGIPILEAIAGGTPCIGATGSCLEEAGGAGALYIDPDDARGLGEALRSILSDDALRRQLREAGFAHAARFDNTAIAEPLHDLYTRLINGKQQGCK